MKGCLGRVCSELLNIGILNGGEDPIDSERDLCCNEIFKPVPLLDGSIMFSAISWYLLEGIFHLQTNIFNTIETELRFMLLITQIYHELQNVFFFTQHRS